MVSSRRSDSRAREKNSRRKNIEGRFPPPNPPRFHDVQFKAPHHLAATLYYLNAWNRLWWPLRGGQVSPNRIVIKNLTAKTVDEDSADCQRWISEKKKQERKTRSPKTTAKLIITRCIITIFRLASHTSLLQVYRCYPYKCYRCYLFQVPGCQKREGISWVEL